MIRNSEWIARENSGFVITTFEDWEWVPCCIAIEVTGSGATQGLLRR
jgi:hypothetical protein